MVKPGKLTGRFNQVDLLCSAAFADLRLNCNNRLEYGALACVKDYGLVF